MADETLYNEPYHMLFGGRIRCWQQILNDARREIEGRDRRLLRGTAFYQGNAKAEQNLMEQTTQPFGRAFAGGKDYSSGT